VEGTCKAGYTQTGNQPPRRSCGADGTWSETENPCTRAWPPWRVLRQPLVHCGLIGVKQDGFVGAARGPALTGLQCSSTVDDATHASFAPADAGSTNVAGVCLQGYGPSTTPPSRSCQLTGVWGSVTGSCERTWPFAAQGTGHKQWALTAPAGRFGVRWRNSAVLPQQRVP